MINTFIKELRLWREYLNPVQTRIIMFQQVDPTLNPLLFSYFRFGGENLSIKNYQGLGS